MVPIPKLPMLVAAGMLLSGVVIARPPPSPDQLVLHDDDSAAAATTTPRPQRAPRKLHGKFLHLTDLHPDEFYKVHSSTDADNACHRGKGAAGTYGAETSDCDSPYDLVDATFAWIEEHIKDDIDFVIWTGDSARHDSDEQIPRSPAQVLNGNRMVADKFLQVFSDPTDRGLVIPIVPTLGNNDILPHNILLPGPNKWLQYYTDIWGRFIPEEQRHSFEFGGWFYVEVIPNRLAVFSLNTLYFFDRNAGVDDCVHPSEPGYKQMEWLRIQLQFMRQRGMKAILMGHVPPARTGSKQLWDESCWQKYTLWLRQYRDVVVGGLYGHMNIDHFLLQDTHEIDYHLVGAAADGSSSREAMEDELDIMSTADYLQELRDGWAKLPEPTLYQSEDSSHHDTVDSTKRKHKKKKKHGTTWGERYQLSLVGPSVVPNYFPTLRVIEYNISGLEDSALWVDDPDRDTAAVSDSHEEQEHLELRHLFASDADSESEQVEADKKTKKKKKKPKKPKDPNLIVPYPPSKSSPPGPAYSPQPLSLTGYTQYFANLTHINNDITADSAPVDPWRWRKGKHHGKDPKSKKPKPRTFKYQVEYSTFADKIYNLTDLTVNSFLELAYRMGQKTAKLHEIDKAARDEEDVEADKKKKNKKKKKHNKVWLHFLRHAFVRTVERDELEKLDD